MDLHLCLCLLCMWEAHCLYLIMLRAAVNFALQPKWLLNGVSRCCHLQVGGRLVELRLTSEAVTS